MKSIKPGRGPSFMGGIISIFMGLFGVLWVAMVLYSGGGFFALFGVIFIAIAVVNAIYNFKNASRKNRYSAYDITDGTEEPDPLNQRFGSDVSNEEQEKANNNFCPWCGTAVDDSFEYCNNCGKKLP